MWWRNAFWIFLVIIWNTSLNLLTLYIIVVSLIKIGNNAKNCTSLNKKCHQYILRHRLGRYSIQIFYHTFTTYIAKLIIQLTRLSLWHQCRLCIVQCACDVCIMYIHCHMCWWKIGKRYNPSLYILFVIPIEPSVQN